MEKKSLSKWFARTAAWFVLFVRSGDELKIVDRLSRKLDSEKYAIFTPTIDTPKRLRGNVMSQKTVCFAGYVFIATTENIAAVRATVKPIIAKDKHIYKMLADGEPQAVGDADRAILTALLNEEFNIAKFEAVDVGDRVTITDGRFVDIANAVVKSVNMHMSTAVIEFEFFGQTRTQTVMLEFVEANGRSTDN